MERNARGRQATEGGPALSIATTPDAESDPLATWNIAMPAAILATPKLTDGGRIVGGYVWALANHTADALVRTTIAAIAEALAMPATSVGRYLRDLHRAGFISIPSKKRGKPEHGGGSEFRVYGLEALAPGPRVHPPSDSPQGRLPLSDADDLLERCRATAAEIDAALRGGRNQHHSTYTWIVVASALLACDVPLPLYCPDQRKYIETTLEREAVLSAARAAGRRGEGNGGRGVGQGFYNLLGDRLQAVAKASVRRPSMDAVREACHRIGWPWCDWWERSRLDLFTDYQYAARNDGEKRTFNEWLAALDRESRRGDATT